MKKVYFYRLIVTVSLSFIFCLLYSCDFFKTYDCEQYGVAFNEERKKLGLIPLDSSWSLKKETHHWGCNCEWSKSEIIGYAKKSVELNSDGKLKEEIDEYYLGYTSIIDPDDPNEYPVYKYFRYNFQSNEWSSSQSGEVNNVPIYNIRTSIMERDIDFLHYIHQIPWSHLPYVDTTKFPLLKGN